MTMEYLPPVFPNQPDSGDFGHGKKMHLDRRQFEYTCGIFTIALDAWVDGTGERCRISTGRTTFFIMSARNVPIWNLFNRGLQAYVMLLSFQDGPADPFF